MGGVWERMVDTVKRSLQKTIGRRKLTEELFHTTLLFSCTFARPRNTKVYRVFHCPTWEESAMIKITHSDAKGKRRTNVVNVISQTTKVLG
ncbi:hypothetical protein Y032_0545g3253 [Ancylostoma ceylanicum]|uniref:Phlebovirus glycoprotein G2 fusion domain-containing protein n=1 Tax=Ancylostoma ceylanicum TaxID=53326 RepID=A0A016WQL3_9BILA|nr:hypothetical protein Y032_0545g3253 [Ancylostoma ceylanicum]